MPTLKQGNRIGRPVSISVGLKLERAVPCHAMHGECVTPQAKKLCHCGLRRSRLRGEPSSQSTSAGRSVYGITEIAEHGSDPSIADAVPQKPDFAA
ncbi:hypothetical protein J2W22_004466 [Sphingomonas kyeonggiensis]|nr:hypothetical protein [Sphingomonas kyeonggiensis]